MPLRKRGPHDFTTNSGTWQANVLLESYRSDLDRVIHSHIPVARYPQQSGEIWGGVVYGNILESKMNMNEDMSFTNNDTTPPDLEIAKAKQITLENTATNAKLSRGEMAVLILNLLSITK